ncbi:ABC transporter substrate-binding protein [Streptomyces sp. NPDC003036]|uniref:caspase, EACC1-associated type n=1 Tax=Streptomyces sp. NPDC003036 TaxID=3154442 RepID=UPI0033B157E1
MSALPDPAASRALLIGVHAYRTLTDLPAVEQNLTGLAQAFTDPDLWGLPSSHCVTLAQPASAQAVLDTLTRVAQSAEDTLVIYYGGHGLTDPYSDELYLALPDSDQERLYTALSYDWVRRALLDPRVRARRKVVILDCCYSGRALVGGMSATDQVADHADIDGTSLLAASAETRRALSPPGERYTAFTSELITALTEGIPDGPELLDMDTLYRHVYGRLAAKARPLPQQRNRNAGGRIALARNRALAVPEPESEPPKPPAPKPSKPKPPPILVAQRPPVVPPAPRKDRRRRRFVIEAAVAVVLLAAGIPALIAWRDDAAPKGTDKAAGAGYGAATGKVVNKSSATGGELRFVATADADSWDPQRMYYGFAWNFARFYTRQLVTYAPEPGAQGTELVPDLATDRAEVTDGGKTYTYTLRPGITWEDGSDITSHDIKHGIERARNQDALPGGPRYLLDTLKAIETPDARTIRFRLNKPNGDFEHMLAMPAGSPVKKEKDTGADYGSRPFSSGPYKFATYNPNESLTLERNPKWQRASDTMRAALPDRITVTFVAKSQQAEHLLGEGKADLDLNAAGMAPGVAQAPELRAHLDNPRSGFLSYVALPQTVAPFDNLHCRKAVLYAVNRVDVQAKRGGPQDGGEIAPHMLPPFIKGSDPAYDPYGVRRNAKGDRSAALKALKACGRPDGFTTTIAVRSYRDSDEHTAEVLTQSLAAVGITARMEKVDAALAADPTAFRKTIKEKGYGLVIRGWGADFPTGQGFLRPLIDDRVTGSYNFAEVDDAVLRQLIDQAIAESDPYKAAKTYAEINRRLADAAYYLPLLHDRRLIWRGPRLTNVYTTDAYGAYDYVSLGVRGVG